MDDQSETISIQIASGISIDIYLKNPMDEVLSIEEFLRRIPKDIVKKVTTALEKLYSDLRKCDYPILPQFLALAYMKLRKIKYLTVLHKELHADNGKLAERLGFKKNDGKVQIPTYKNFWNFLKIRLKADSIDNISTTALVELDKELSMHDVVLAGKIGHDGIAIRSHDKEAVYNDHYKMTMYKGEVGFDLDLLLPLHGTATTGTDYDGNYVIPFAERVEGINKQHRTLYADGHYPTIHNFAVLNHVYRWNTVMNIPGDQRIISDVGTVDNIDKWYQKLHAKDDFTVGATIDDKLSVLMKYGRVDEVGYYYRNLYVSEYLKNPDAYTKDYHNRSLEETGNNCLKNGLVDIENTCNGTGLRNRNLHLKLCILTVQLVAATRAHYGITDRGMVSVKNIGC